MLTSLGKQEVLAAVVHVFRVSIFDAATLLNTPTAIATAALTTHVTCFRCCHCYGDTGVGDVPSC